jgi:signal transduction histidine kinase
MTTSIFIVEDEVVIAMEIESVLQQLGYQVAGSAMSGEEAIVRTAETRPDLILMDIRLKGEMDGITAADRIYRLYKIPVIFLTAHSDKKTLEKAIAVHPFGYLIKPFRKNELYTAIEIALYKHRALFAERELKRALFKENVIDHITQYDIFNKTLAITGYLELLSRDASPADPGSEYIRKIQDLVQHIRNRIQFEGEYSRLGQKSAEWQDVTPMIQAAADTRLPALITVENRAGALEIYADPLFSQIFAHLFENSSRHGRTVDRIRVTFQTRDSYGILSIEDNGVGIPKEAKKSLFSHDTQYGCGKGLFLVQEILQISGMTISETGVPGTGARFEIAIPKEQYRQKPGVMEDGH